jgi:hypothetical protein
MAHGSMRNPTDPTFVDLRPREVVNVRCHCGREVQIDPFQLIGHHGVTQHTRVWALRDLFRCTKCRRRPPKELWVAKWQD